MHIYATMESTSPLGFDWSKPAKPSVIMESDATIGEEECGLILRQYETMSQAEAARNRIVEYVALHNLTVQDWQDILSFAIREA
jgi:hypothetical protein